jgi:hypothetical protein
MNQRPIFTIPSFPYYTQAVGRCVKMVTEASMTVTSQKARDGVIRTKIMSTTKMPSFDSKKQYKA